MVHFYPSLDDNLADWAMKQAVFFTATAPTHGSHVNLSPKGLPATSFSVLNPNLCAYVDATGSGIETDRSYSGEWPSHHHVLFIRSDAEDLATVLSRESGWLG